MLLIAKAVQRRWVIRHRGASRVLLVGDASDEMASEMQRLRGRRVERCHELRPGRADGALPRPTPIDEVVLSPRLSAERIGDLVELCAEAGLPAFVPIDHGNNPDLELPPPTVETVGHAHFVVYHRRLGNASTLLLEVDHRPRAGGG